MSKIKIFCVTNEIDPILKSLYCEPAGVGKANFPFEYIKCTTGNNIFNKDKYYSELTFHYWFWKNMLSDCDKNLWIGFCQYRRYWLNENYDKSIAITRDNLKVNMLSSVPLKWSDYNSVICKKIKVNNIKISKLLKHGKKSLIKDPSILLNKKKRTIKLHFDMWHGFGNLDKAIELLNVNDRNDFRNYVNNNTAFNPNIMFISQPKIMNEWFKNLFKWLDDCESLFGFKNLSGYETTRLYAYLAERYLSYWFNKYTFPIEWPWTFIDMKKN